ncbi:ATP-binding cassette sub-family G member 5 [Lingula anatina]|uniref:ATP-binding cassette sub-family G member 5 n=1 Tax=Lingula anatina TaxID=7574 RepID=A0A1S3IXB5_LINAN|nr:ATP-binding cassette sub-family G member 5 [Lingula anatina]|eukprot:XP_013402842.1 ATP-binding cassette sub-family G member 5 [Lingula anatina]
MTSTPVVSETSPLLPSHENKRGSYSPGSSGQISNSYRCYTPADLQTPFTLCLEGVSYSVKEDRGPWWKNTLLGVRRTKEILKDVRLIARSGQLTAILGNSGSGKTSLLDVICNRMGSNGKLQGLVWGTPGLIESAGYVIQADRLMDNLTVKETLTYTAKLKFVGKSSKNLKERVEAVISEMGLRPVRNTRIGGMVERGISGGEKRRVTIAIQLLQNPQMLLLDEPTTGLDSFTAHYLVQTLAELAQRNKIVLCTIHQPRSELYKTFDQVGIMSRGEMIYFGKATEMVPYFSRLGYPCPTFANPLDHYVDLSSIDTRSADKEKESDERVNYLRANLLQSPHYISMLGEITEAMEADNHGGERVCVSWMWNSNNMLRFFVSLFILVRRSLVNLYRNRSAFFLRIFTQSVFAGMICLFLGKLRHNQQSIQDRIGLLYQTVAVPPFSAMLHTIEEFPSLRDLYYRESRDGLYVLPAFLLSFCLYTLPFSILSSILYSTLTYWVCGLQPDPKLYAMHAATVFFLHYSGEIMTVILLGMMQNPRVASSIVALILTISGLIAPGFLRTVSSMPEIIQWLSWASPYKYAGEIFVANEFNNLTLHCGSDPVLCLRNGSLYITLFYPGALDHMTRNFAALGGFIFGFIVIAMVIFKIFGIKQLH